MRSLKLFTWTALALFSFVCLLSAPPAQAQAPRYLHALTNLRQARAWLRTIGDPQFADLRGQVVGEIDHAIAEVKKAAKDDGTYTNWTPPPSVGGNPGAPYLSALQLLDVAHGDVTAGHDAPDNFGLQVRALSHIDEARRTIHRIRHLKGAE